MTPWIIAALAAAAALAFYLSSRRKDSNLKLLLEALENGDSSVRFPRRPKVNDVLNRIASILSNMRIQAEQQEHYNELILNFAETGIMVIDTDGNILRRNTKALKMLGLPVLTHVRQLDRVLPGLAAKVFEALPGQHLSAGLELSITLQVGGIKIGGRELKVVSMTDIALELGSREAETWTQLSRTLAHEIMNSLAPIISLSDTLLTLPDEDAEDRREGLTAIGRTGRSLMNFVENYRRMTRLPHPNPQQVSIDRLLSTVASLIPQVRWEAPAGMEVVADPDMIQSVIMNLCTNAVQSGAGSIRIKAMPWGTIEVSNDGEPIPPEIVPNIFTPFFTTRPSGSGIGLSMSRQIMSRSGGSLTLLSASAPVTFRLTLPVK